MNDQTIHAALRAPDAAELRIAASQLHHPILQPLTIDPARGFTPEQAAVVAVLLNPDLRGVRDQRGLTRAQLLQAGLLPNPTLTGSLDFPYDDSFPDNFLGYGAGLEWEVTALLTRDAKIKSARASSASIDLDIAWKEWQTAQAARLAAYDVLALQGQLRAARQAQSQFDDNLAAIRKAVERHDKTWLDLDAAQASDQDSIAAVVGLERDLSHQRLALNQAMGLPPRRVVVIRFSDPSDALPSRLDPPDAPALEDGLQDRRLDLLALQRGYESEDQTLRAAILAQFPRISLGFNAARDNSNVKSIGPTISIDLPIFDHNQGTIATEKATRRKLFDEFAARVFAARSDIATAISDIRGSDAEVAAAQAALPGLQKLADTYAAALEHGNIDVLSAYQAKAAVWQKRIEVIKLKQQLIHDWIALELASGQAIPMKAGATSRATTDGAPTSTRSSATTTSSTITPRGATP